MKLRYKLSRKEIKNHCSKKLREWIISIIPFLNKRIVNLSKDNIDSIDDRLRKLIGDSDYGRYIADNVVVKRKSWVYYETLDYKYIFNIVMNVKDKGFPDYEDVICKLSIETGIEKKELRSKITEDLLNEIVWDEIGFRVETIQNEVSNFSVVGILGVWWGVGFNKGELQYSFEIDEDRLIRVIKDNIRFSIPKIIDSIFNDYYLDSCGDKITVDDILEIIGIDESDADSIAQFIFLALEGKYMYNAYSLLKECYLIKMSLIELLGNLEGVINSTMDQLEKPDLWVDVIMNNKYYL